MRIRFLVSLVLAASVLSASTPANPAAAPATPEPVVFTHFSYRGTVDDGIRAPLPPDEFRNPILAGFYPDPSVCRVGDDFYLINSTFAYFPGIPIFHSRDLVSWRQIGHVIDRPTQLKYDGLGVSRAIFAPALSHHDGTFYVVCTQVGAGGNFLVTAKNPAGPWSNPVWLGFDGIDPSLFFDEETGRAWMVNNGNAPDDKPLYDGHRAIWIQEFDVKAQTMIGPRQILINGGVDLAKKPVWVEGPHLYRRGEWYYLCCAEGGTSDQHSQVIFRGQSPTGPFVPWSGNPILTQRDLDGTATHAVTSTGHADLVVGPDGNWWSVFLGCRPYSGKWYATGRETFLLPVEWTDDGWPRILAPGRRVPLRAPKPSAGSPASPAALRDALILNGAAAFETDFAGATLPDKLIMLRAPKETWWSVGGPEPALRLTPRRPTLGGTENPSYLGYRLQHARFETRLTLRPPTTPGTSAGLAAFQSETHHYYFAVVRSAAGKAGLIVERASGPKPEVIARVLLPECKTVTLRLRANEGSGEFAFATDAASGAFTPVVADADLTLLTTQASWGFVGATTGPHARLESAPTE